MQKDLAIRVGNLSKTYRLYDNPTDRVKEAINLFGKKYHREFFALHDISFNITKGETVGIIGKNGSGKSTLLKMITGVLTPTNGNIEVNGKISALLELGAGFNPELTGIENIYLNGTIMGYSKNAMDVKLPEIVSFADIGAFIHQPVKSYSSGMFARLAFAVAINVDPDILIVDEALSVGDIFFQAKCYKKFNEFKKKGKTILFVTHDMGSIIKYCDRVLVINEGILVEDGLPEQMVDVYKRILVNLYHNEDEENKIRKSMDTKSLDDWKMQLTTNPNYSDYGNKKAEIIDYAVFDDQGILTNVIMKNKEFQFKLRIKFNDNIKEPIFAFTIKDLRGTDITGTNTMLESINTGINKQGKLIEVTFKQKITLQGGNYLVSFGCTGFENNEFVVYHRLYDIFDIHVIADKNSVGFFDMNTIIEINALRKEVLKND
jgi:teichoic acid transport system ATP-binding protein